MATYQYKAGLQNVGSYQVSGKPFVTGAHDALSVGKANLPIEFPKVTKWVMIQNHGPTPLRVGFSSASVAGAGNGGEGAEYRGFFRVPASGTTSGPGVLGPLDLKLTRIYLSGSHTVEVVAGLTFIDPGAINNPSMSPDPVSSSYTNWTGSVGVSR